MSLCVGARASPPSLSVSDDTALFIRVSCTSRLQREVTHSYLPVKAPRSGLARYSLLAQPLSTLPSSPRLLNATSSRAGLDGAFAGAPVDPYFPLLDSQAVAGLEG